MTDTEAKGVSRLALQQAGVSLTDLVPRPFDGTNYFARNLFRPDTGYVLWKKARDNMDAYSVELTPSGTNVVCEIGGCH